MERCLYRGDVERTADVPRVARRHRIRRPARLDAVEIRLRRRAVARGKVPAGLPGFFDDDVLRQQAVRRARDPFHGDCAVRKEIHDLPIGVDARVRASGRREFDAVAENPFELFLEHVLHGDDGRRLPLEARVGRAVIRNLEGDVAPPRLHHRLVFFLHANPFGQTKASTPSAARSTAVIAHAA